MNKKTDPKNPEREGRWLTVDPAGNTEVHEMNKNKQGQWVKGKHIRTDSGKKNRSNLENEWKRKNTIAFKKKYKVSPNFAAFSLLIGGGVSFFPYALYISDKLIIRGKLGNVVYHGGKIVFPGQEIWPLELWIMLFLPLIILGIVLRVMNNKYETGLDKFINMFKKFKGF